MDDKRSVIISAIIGILVLALIIGVVVYLIRFITNRSTNPNATARPSATVVQNDGSVPTGDGEARLPVEDNSGGDAKTYQGRGFELIYPKDWGLLICNNSTNIELDPTNSADQRGVACDRALKPITILVGQNSCTGGESVNKGGVTFTRIRTEIASAINYKWCTQTNPNLEITHRVSQSGSRATSREDFSGVIEEMISRTRFGSSI